MLRRRLLAAIGSASLGTLSGCWSAGSSGCPSSPLVDQVAGTLADGAEACPPNPFYAADQFSDLVPAYCTPPAEDYWRDTGDPYWGGIQVTDVRLLRKLGDECRYELSCDYTPDCPGGRPIHRDGAPVLAEAVERPDWRASLTPNLSNLDEADRARLAAYWFRAASEEHSSIAGFNRLAMELLAHGAPPNLVQATLRAALDEVAHAQDAFALASAFTGQPLGPAGLPLGPQVELSKTLVELAVSTAREGAVGEALAAQLAASRLQRATDPAVRAVLERVAQEEAQHAELAWRILRWALEIGGAPVHTALSAVFDELAHSSPPTSVQPSELESHGMLGADADSLEVHQCIHRVLLPVAATLLATQRAA
ncbi:MAG: ferritin-like domain-containing protein [Proteobacteria bacterium]|nr:ferritin-like domain-containing protein [Pseudomonadota bacterium]